MNFLIVLGRTHILATCELTRVLSVQYPDVTPVFLKEFIVKVTLPTLDDAIKLQNLLGGVVKIVAIDEEKEQVSGISLNDEIATLLQKLTPEGKGISFGLCEYGRENKPALSLMEIKRELTSRNVSSRFIEGPKEGLSASVLLHQNVDEVVIFETPTTLYLGHTVTVQNIDEWSFRDRSKPFADRKHGMLPPKVARMMINIALPEGVSGKRILDPFCGTGTVLLEAAVLGAHPVGSDIRQDAVDQTRGNLKWLNEKEFAGTDIESPIDLTYITLSDATKVTSEMFAGEVDAIVAEGFLGPMTPEPKRLDNIFKGLEKLYLGAFKQWRKVLVPGGRVCLALPRVETKMTVYSLSRLIDSLSSLGYNSILTPLSYDRPDAVVKREIFILEYQPKD